MTLHRTETLLQQEALRRDLVRRALHNVQARGITLRKETLRIYEAYLGGILSWEQLWQQVQARNERLANSLFTYKSRQP